MARRNGRTCKKKHYGFDDSHGCTSLNVMIAAGDAARKSYHLTTPVSHDTIVTHAFPEDAMHQHQHPEAKHQTTPSTAPRALYQRTVARCERCRTEYTEAAYRALRPKATSAAPPARKVVAGKTVYEVGPITDPGLKALEGVRALWAECPQPLPTGEPCKSGLLAFERGGHLLTKIEADHLAAACGIAPATPAPTSTPAATARGHFGAARALAHDTAANTDSATAAVSKAAANALECFQGVTERFALARGTADAGDFCNANPASIKAHCDRASATARRVYDLTRQPAAFDPLKARAWLGATIVCLQRLLSIDLTPDGLTDAMDRLASEAKTITRGADLASASDSPASASKVTP